MSDSLFEAGLEELGTGMMPGTNDDAVPLWVDMFDILFDGAALRPMPGFSDVVIASGLFDEHAGLFDSASGLFDSSVNYFPVAAGSADPVKGITQQRMRDGTPIIIWGSDAALFRSTDVAQADVTNSGGAYTGLDLANEVNTSSRWSFTAFGDWTFATNGRDPLQVLKGKAATNFIDAVGFPVDTCQIVRTLGPHVIGFNCTGTYAPTTGTTDQNQAIWCAEDDVEEWDPTVNATAGELTMRDINGPIVAVEKIGDALALYSEHDMHLFRYGGDFLFTSKPAVAGLRAVSKDSVAVLGAVNFVLNNMGIWMTDGTQAVPKAYPRFGDWLERNVDWTQQSRICNLTDQSRNVIKWVLPMVDGTIKTLVYSAAADSILGFESRPFTAACRATALTRPLAGFSNGSIQQLIDTPVGRAPYLLTKPIAVGGKQANAFVDALLLDWSGPEVLWSYRFAENRGGIASASWIPLTGNTTEVEQLLFMCNEGGYFQFKMESDENLLWKLSAMRVMGKGRGKRF